MIIEVFQWGRALSAGCDGETHRTLRHLNALFQWGRALSAGCDAALVGVALVALSACFNGAAP